MSPPPPSPDVPRKPRRRQPLRRVLFCLLGIVVVLVLALAGLGLWFLTLRDEHPAAGVVLRAVLDLPASGPDEARRAARRADYLYGERLGELRSRRAGNTLGSALRLGSLETGHLELRDRHGSLVARAARRPGGAVDELRLEVADGEGGMVHRLSLTRGLDASGSPSTELHFLGSRGLEPCCRLVDGRGFGRLLGLAARSGSVLERQSAAGDRALLFASAEAGVLDLLAQGSHVSFLEPPPGLLDRMLGREGTALRFRFRIEAEHDFFPWTEPTGGYTLLDDRGELAGIRLEDFFLRYRGQVFYHYLVDLDGNGRLDQAIETIESVLVARQPGPASDRQTVEIRFLAGTARVEDVEAFRLGDALELMLADAVAKGGGRDSDLAFIEEARDDILLLLEPSPAAAAAALVSIDPLRAAADYGRIARAGKRPYAETMVQALGLRLAEPRFATREEAAALGADPPRAGAAAPVPPPAAASPAIAPPGGAPVVETALPAMSEPDARLLAHAEALLRETGGAAWPGFGGELPALLLVGGEVEWLLRHPHPPEDFERLGHSSLLGTELRVRKRSFDPGFQACFPIEGVATVVMGTAAGTGLSAPRWALTYVHEAFHAFQLAHGELDRTARLSDLAQGDLTGMWQLDYAFPYADPAAGQALALLGIALDRGIGAIAGAHAGGVEPAGTAEAARASLGAVEAMAALLRPEDLSYLRFVEWKEGVARHVELRVAQLAAAGGMAPPTPESAAPYSDAAKEIDERIRETLRSLGPGRLKREVFYATGAGLARLLDARLQGWSERYLDPTLTLEDLLAVSVGVQGVVGRPTPWVTGGGASLGPSPGPSPGASPGPGPSTGPGSSPSP